MRNNVVSPISQLQRPLALYQEPILKSVFYRNDSTLGSYLACLGAEVFKFLWRVFFFCGFSAEGEQKPKLVPTHPQMCDGEEYHFL